MPRFPELTRAKLSTDQRDAHDAWLKGRGAARGPVNLLLRSPSLARAFERTGAYLRFESPIPAKLREFAIIIVARYWTAQFEWHIHSGLALEAGLSRNICDAIAHGHRPSEMDAGENAVFEFTTSLLVNGSVDDDAFSRALTLLGDQGLTDLVGLIGYYCAISFVLNVDQQTIPHDVEPLKPISRPFR
jgi:4-carboxymuconolactone decarboxylase